MEGLPDGQDRSYPEAIGSLVHLSVEQAALQPPGAPGGWA